MRKKLVCGAMCVDVERIQLVVEILRVQKNRALFRKQNPLMRMQRRKKILFQMIVLEPGCSEKRLQIKPC